MTTDRTEHVREKGIALVYVGVFLVPLLMCAGLALDLGRGYLVRVALAKAVDAAALAAARTIAGDRTRAEEVAENIFTANFPANFLGVTGLQTPPHLTFEIARDGSNKITVASSATVPTTFMRIAKFDSLTVAATATATRRLVDMSFVLDRSGSLQGVFPDVKQAAETFASYFDPVSDRVALISFSAGTTVEDSMSGARGFNLQAIQSHIAGEVASGPTATAEALYEAWDQLRTVPSDSQSGLRIVVLFTDGTPNAFPGAFPQVAATYSACSSPFTSTTDRGTVPNGTLAVIEYPNVSNRVYTIGLYDTYSAHATAVAPTNVNFNDPHSYKSSSELGVPDTTQNTCIPFLPLRTAHQQNATGLPTGFLLSDPNLGHQRPLIGATADGYPDNPRNTFNAARNLAESIANAIRSDTSGASKIRIYALGLGNLLDQPLGNPAETGSSILRRIANDPSSPDFNPDQLDGRYYFAGDPAQLSVAFQAVRDQIVRLTQ